MDRKPVSIYFYKTPINITISTGEESMEEDQVIEWGPYKAIADRCRLSERTIRTAFARKPVVYETACRIAKTLGIPVTCLRIKADTRGQNKGKKK